MSRAAQTAAERLRLIGGRWDAWTTVRVGKLSRRLRESSGFTEAERAKAEIWLQDRLAEIERELTAEQGWEPMGAEAVELRPAVAKEIARQAGGLAWNFRARFDRIEEL